MRPSVVVFDVNETISDLSPLAARFVAVGAPASLAQLWFTSVLRDGFALTMTGRTKPFTEIAEVVLRSMLDGLSLDRRTEAATAYILDGFSELQVHPDVSPGVIALADQGFRLVTLSNGSASVAEGLLTRSGLRDRFERLLSVEQAGAWKPDRRAYQYAARELACPEGEMVLVAVHPWDVDGAARAGLQTAWLNRSEGPYPDVFTAPTCAVPSLEKLADQLQ